MGRGNPKAFEGVREATQFQAAGDEPLTAKVDLRLKPSMAADLKAIKNWQAELREAIARLIASKKNPPEQEQLNRDGKAEDAIASEAVSDRRENSTDETGGTQKSKAGNTGTKSKGRGSPKPEKTA